jgi:hypothetical protein
MVVVVVMAGAPGASPRQGQVVQRLVVQRGCGGYSAVIAAVGAGCVHPTTHLLAALQNARLIASIVVLRRLLRRPVDV